MKSEKGIISVDVSVDEWEKKVVGLIANGLTVSEVAKETKDKTRPLEYRLSQLKTRLQCKTSAQLVAFFLRNKLIS